MGNAPTVWICGRYISGEAEAVAWDFQGVFLLESEAVNACRDDSYFVAPAIMGQSLPPTPSPWPGAYYPHQRGIAPSEK